MSEEIKEKINEEILKIMEENQIKQDMLGYTNLYNTLKRQIAKQKYNIILNDDEKEEETID